MCSAMKVQYPHQHKNDNHDYVCNIGYTLYTIHNIIGATPAIKGATAPWQACSSLPHLREDGVRPLAVEISKVEVETGAR